MNQENVRIVLIALYRYWNFPIRTLHALLDETEGFQPYSIFLKNSVVNIFKPPTELEEKLFSDTIIRLNPAIVGFSVLSPYVNTAKRLTGIVKERTDALLKMDCDMYTKLGTDSTIKEKKEVKATSKQIYKYIKGIDEASGDLLLRALDN